MDSQTASSLRSFCYAASTFVLADLTTYLAGVPSGSTIAVIGGMAVFLIKEAIADMNMGSIAAAAVTPQAPVVNVTVPSTSTSTPVSSVTTSTPTSSVTNSNSTATISVPTVSTSQVMAQAAVVSGQTVVITGANVGHLLINGQPSMLYPLAPLGSTVTYSVESGIYMVNNSSGAATTRISPFVDS